MIKPVETTYRGIRFRSRLEAVWFAYLRFLHFDVEYEPEAFELCDGYGKPMGKYAPDFFLPQVNLYVEIKPNRVTYDERDKMSILRAYVLGYTTPTAIILGNPSAYYCVVCMKRHKGCPDGYSARFNEPTKVTRLCEWYAAGCYPDEGVYSEWDPRQHYAVRVEDSYPYYAAESVNVTQWKPRTRP